MLPKWSGHDAQTFLNQCWNIIKHCDSTNKQSPKLRLFNNRKFTHITFKLYKGIMHGTYPSLKCDSYNGPLKYSSTSQSETGIGTLMHSYWLLQSESRLHRGPVCTFCVAFSLAWVGHRACSALCPSSRLVVSSGAEWTGVHHLSAYKKEQTHKCKYCYWGYFKKIAGRSIATQALCFQARCWCCQHQLKACSLFFLLYQHFHQAINTSCNNAENEQNIFITKI